MSSSSATTFNYDLGAVPVRIPFDVSPCDKTIPGIFGTRRPADVARQRDRETQKQTPKGRGPAGGSNVFVY
ncbi:hypothetical protein EVAR_62020_1 [Eumeta japonica]|uniref:Uncharacterized protein n=1 Tax=Eumeta variegata TaxID=151549 RepID=A0A4C1ZBD2_EUMVA|nr:hypothetical protein EVAR_62020_1 [Eumeta japonica]